MSGEDNAPGRGSRRKKIVGYLKAANDLRHNYTSASLGSGARSDLEDDDEENIPGAFPNLKVSRSGKEELVLFPSYARRHTKGVNPNYPNPSDLRDASGSNDADYWRKEWEVYEDENAIIDVDTRGWIYTPHKGPMNKKNRVLLGIARHLSGIPASSGNTETTPHEEKIAERKVEELTRRGEEGGIVEHGGFVERLDNISRASSRSVSPKPSRPFNPVEETSSQDKLPGPSYLQKVTSWSTMTTDMSSEELTTANTQLMKRLKPFFTTPAVGMSITIFYFNDQTSQSRTTHTNDSGHFNFRAALDFIPTHVRVLASEDLSASSEVIITEPNGVSLISDIDDTIKHSAIGMGAREIFRNAFVRDLGDLVIQGVREWYYEMSEMGVKIHYVSNSPWQMYPLLVTFLGLANLPNGSVHLKQYTGMLQGIFEPVAERKKATLDRIMSDFPERKFILVGDSGEADLEIYTDTALREPKRILAIFIRDVSSSQAPDFFDATRPDDTAVKDYPKAFPPPSQPVISPSASGSRKAMEPRAKSAYPPTIENEDLMTFSESELLVPKPIKKTESLEFKRTPPVPPVKPVALRSASGSIIHSSTAEDTANKPPQLPARKMVVSLTAQSKRNVPDKVKSVYHTLSPSSDVRNGNATVKEEPKPPRLPTSLSDGKSTNRPAPPVPPRRGLTAYPAAAASYASNRVSAYWNGTDPVSRGTNQAPVNKKEELWNRRLAKAKEVLEGKGILLKTWRVGSDVEKDAIMLVEQHMKK